MEKHQALKGVIFDFDGTLVKLSVNWERTKERLSKFWKNHGFNSKFSPLLSELEKAKQFSISISDGKLWQNTEEILNNEEMAGLEQAMLMEDTVELLSLISSVRIPFIIVSNNGSKVIQAAIKKFNLPKPEIFVARDTEENWKPNPKGTINALKKIKVRANECWLIGDNEYDIALGKELRVDKIFILSNVNTIDNKYKISSLFEIIEMLMSCKP